MLSNTLAGFLKHKICRTRSRNVFASKDELRTRRSPASRHFFTKFNKKLTSSEAYLTSRKSRSDGTELRLRRNGSCINPSMIRAACVGLISGYASYQSDFEIPRSLASSELFKNHCPYQFWLARKMLLLPPQRFRERSGRDPETKPIKFHLLVLL